MQPNAGLRRTVVQDCSRSTSATSSTTTVIATYRWQISTFFKNITHVICLLFLLLLLFILPSYSSSESCEEGATLIFFNIVWTKSVWQAKNGNIVQSSSSVFLTILDFKFRCSDKRDNSSGNGWSVSWCPYLSREGDNTSLVLSRCPLVARCEQCKLRIRLK